MANRTFLFQASSSTPFDYDEGSPDVLAAASNCIPIFWYALFDSSSLISHSLKLGNGEIFTFPCFVSSTSEARVRCQRRATTLERLTPASHASVLEAWFRFLDTIELSHVHVNTAELCMAADGFDQHFASSLAAFDSPLPSSESFASRTDWLEMLDVAEIDPNDLAGSVAGHKLAGYSWSKPVPWNFKT